MTDLDELDDDALVEELARRAASQGALMDAWFYLEDLVEALQEAFRRERGDA